MNFSIVYDPIMDEYSPEESVAPLLTAFDAVAREGHVTRASDTLGVPQSSVSRRIRALERALGVALIHKSGRGVALTASGRAFFERTHDVVRALENAVSAVRDDADPEAGTVRVGLPLTAGAEWIATLLKDFHKTAPRVRMHLFQAHGELLDDMIGDGRLDIAVMIPPPHGREVRILGTQRLMLHVPSSHSLADRQVVAFGELADEHFIASPTSFHLRSLLDAWCSEAGFVPLVPFEINEIDTIRNLVGSGLGIAVLPASEATTPGIVEIPLLGKRTRDVGLVTAPHRPTAAVTRFLDHLTLYDFTDS